MSEARAVRTFGRARSRTLRPSQAERLGTLLPRLRAPGGSFNPRVIWPSAAEVWLEIGFGSGEHLAAQAARRPDTLFLGAEPFVNGLASLLGRIEADALGNIRLHDGDARELMDRLPNASLDRLYVLFPDPWPKRRHHKRRLVDARFAAESARLLRAGGLLRFATDWADYADQALAALLAEPRLSWTAERADDWRRPPGDHVRTRYEGKRLGDCEPIWLEFIRRPEAGGEIEITE